MSNPYTLAETWLLNNRVNLMLLDHLSEEQLAVAANPRARTVGDQIAHLHNVRKMWLEVRPGGTDLKAIDKGKATKEKLRHALSASAEALAKVISEAEAAGKMPGYKRGPASFVGYALAHEAHHRGQIILHLKYAKKPVDRMFGFSLWEWQKI